MPAAHSPQGCFIPELPRRFVAVIAEARGAMRGIEASASPGGDGDGLLGLEALRRFHEIYRLRIELEIETAAVLWRTAEVVYALTDASEALRRRLDNERVGGAASLAAVRARREGLAERERLVLGDRVARDPGQAPARDEESLKAA
jgi:hypothetical protein